MNSSFCCTCAGTCCHTGPHMYCEKHMGSALRVLADIVLPCPSCAKWSVTANDQAQTIEALRARVAVLEKVVGLLQESSASLDPSTNVSLLKDIRAALDAAKEGK